MKGQRGIGVIEMLVGIGLIAVAILGLNSLAISATRGNLSARFVDQATSLAQQKIEQIKRNGYTAAVPGTTLETGLAATGASGGGFVRTTTIAAGRLPATRTVTVAIAWTDYVTRQATFVTEIVSSDAGGGRDGDDDDDGDDEDDGDDDDHGDDHEDDSHHDDDDHHD